MKVAGDSHIKGVEHRSIHLQNLPMHLGTRLFLLAIRMARSFQIMTGLHAFFFFKICQRRTAMLGDGSPHRSSPSPGSACPGQQCSPG